jgi:WD40 repeat protein
MVEDSLVADLQEPVGYVHDLAISPDGEIAAVYCGNDQTLHFYSVPTGERRDVAIELRGYIDIAGFTSDSTRLAYAPLNGFLPDKFVTIDLEGHTQAEIPAGGYLSQAAYSPGNDLFVAQYESQTIDVLNLADLSLKRRTEAAAFGKFDVSANGRFSLTIRGGVARVTSLDDGSVVGEMTAPDDPTQSRSFYSMAISPDGQYAAFDTFVSSRKRPPEIWNLRNRSVTPVDTRSSQILFLADGTLAVATGQQGVRFFDPSTGESVSPPFQLVRVAGAGPPT